MIARRIDSTPIPYRSINELRGDLNDSVENMYDLEPKLARV